MKKAKAIANIAQRQGISDAEAEYLFEERVGIKAESCTNPTVIHVKSAMRQAYEELMNG